MELSKIVQDNVKNTITNIYDTFMLENDAIVTSTAEALEKMFNKKLISSQISLLEAELERKKVRKDTLEKIYKGYELETAKQLIPEIDSDITYLQEQIDLIKKMV